MEYPDNEQWTSDFIDRRKPVFFLFWLLFWLPMINDAQKMRILREAIENGIIDIDSINVEMQKKKEKEYLENHTSSVWQSSNGFWYTYLTVDSKRKLVKRKNKQDLEQEIICYYKAKDPDLNPTFEQEYKAWIAAKKEYHEVKERRC